MLAFPGAPKYSGEPAGSEAWPLSLGSGLPAKVANPLERQADGGQRARPRKAGDLQAPRRRAPSRASPALPTRPEQGGPLALGRPPAGGQGGGRCPGPRRYSLTPGSPGTQDAFRSLRELLPCPPFLFLHRVRTFLWAVRTRTDLGAELGKVFRVCVGWSLLHSMSPRRGFALNCNHCKLIFST